MSDVYSNEDYVIVRNVNREDNSYSIMAISQGNYAEFCPWQFNDGKNVCLDRNDLIELCNLIIEVLEDDN